MNGVLVLFGAGVIGIAGYSGVVNGLWNGSARSRPVGTEVRAAVIDRERPTMRLISTTISMDPSRVLMAPDEKVQIVRAPAKRVTARRKRGGDPVRSRIAELKPTPRAAPAAASATASVFAAASAAASASTPGISNSNSDSHSPSTAAVSAAASATEPATAPTFAPAEVPAFAPGANSLSSAESPHCRHDAAVIGLVSHVIDIAAQGAYPESAFRRGLEGLVRVCFTLDGSGRANDLRVMTSSGETDLDAAALDAVRRAEPLAVPHPIFLCKAIDFRLK